MSEWYFIIALKNSLNYDIVKHKIEVKKGVFHMKFHRIDMDQFSRRKHFEYFSSLQYPYVGLTSEVDVTELVPFCKERSYSFYLTFMHIVALAANDVSEFRQRIRDNGIVEFEKCPTSHIELLDNGTYAYCTLHHDMPLDMYIPYAENARKLCRENGKLEEDAQVESMLFISTVPWLHYTALIQPVAAGEDSNPRITWGKFQKDCNGRYQMPVSVLAHHGLVDGIHIAQFYRNLEKYIAATIANR